MSPPLPPDSPETPPPVAPRLVSLRTLAPEGEATYDWHSHAFEEFTLVTDDACLIGYPPGWRKTAANTLLHYRNGERHGCWSSSQQRPRFWVVHFIRGRSEGFTALGAAEPEKRVWSLTPVQVDTFRWMFLQLLAEHTDARTLRETVTSAWLQLMLVQVQRWAAREKEAVPPQPIGVSSEVLRLWQQVNESVGKSKEEMAKLYTTANYDSVRHAFRNAFGCSPREMMRRLRMESAKNLLLESSLSVKEISARVGYATQHEFNRMFHRDVGMAPSKWRKNPLAKLPHP